MGKKRKIDGNGLRSCFGNISSEECRGRANNCKQNNNEECLSATNIKGPCDCKYKEWCHVPRQEGEMHFIEIGVSKTLEEGCSFYPMFIEDDERAKKAGDPLGMS